MAGQCLGNARLVWCCLAAFLSASSQGVELPIALVTTLRYGTQFGTARVEKRMLLQSLGLGWGDLPHPLQ